MDTPTPKGRLDVLAYRLAQRLVQKHYPDLWEDAQPLVVHLCTMLYQEPEVKRRKRPKVKLATRKVER